MKQTTNSRRSPAQCRIMALDIVRLYISFITEFFEFSDVEITTPTGPEHRPSFLPKGSNSITMAHFLIKALSEVLETISEVSALDISSEVSTNIKSFLESTRRGFQEALIQAWKRGRVPAFLLGRQSSSSPPCRCQSIPSPGGLEEQLK